MKTIKDYAEKVMSHIDAVENFSFTKQQGNQRPMLVVDFGERYITVNDVNLFFLASCGVEPEEFAKFIDPEYQPTNDEVEMADEYRFDGEGWNTKVVEGWQKRDENGSSGDDRGFEFL